MYIRYCLVNHTKSHGTSFTKQNYLTEITGTLINLQINKLNLWQRCLEKPLLFTTDI